MPESEKPSGAITRRDFLINLSLTTVFLGSLVGVATSVIRYLIPPAAGGGASEAVLVGAVADLPANVGRKVVYQGKVVWVINSKQGFRGVSAICTHLGCIVDWEPDRQAFSCPCHAGVFDSEGRVISGPPPKALSAYKLQQREGKVYLLGPA